MVTAFRRLIEVDVMSITFTPFAANPILAVPTLYTPVVVSFVNATLGAETDPLVRYSGAVAVIVLDVMLSVKSLNDPVPIHHFDP